jgi:hypothetical protein
MAEEFDPAEMAAAKLASKDKTNNVHSDYWWLVKDREVVEIFGYGVFSVRDFGETIRYKGPDGAILIVGEKCFFIHVGYAIGECPVNLLFHFRNSSIFCHRHFSKNANQ